MVSCLFGALTKMTMKKERVIVDVLANLPVNAIVKGWVQVRLLCPQVHAVTFYFALSQWYVIVLIVSLHLETLPPLHQHRFTFHAPWLTRSVSFHLFTLLSHQTHVHFVYVVRWVHHFCVERTLSLYSYFLRLAFSRY